MTFPDLAKFKDISRTWKIYLIFSRSGRNLEYCIFTNLDDCHVDTFFRHKCRHKIHHFSELYKKYELTTSNNNFSYLKNAGWDIN